MENKNQIGGNQFLVFSINTRLYSFLIDEVVEILRVPTITKIPGINPVIEGVINLRGSIIPVVNLHKRFNLPKPKKNKKNRIIIVQGRNENIGLIVDEVKMVTKFDENSIEPTFGQTLEKDIFNGFAKLGERVIGFLNLEKVLYNYNHSS